MTYWSDNDALVQAHPGEVLQELAIFRILKNGEEAPDTIIAEVYREKVRRRVPECPNQSETYGMTHDVFFATDFGRRPFTGYDAEGWAEMLERVATEQWEHPDLLGEIIMCVIFLGLWDDWTDSALVHYRTLFDALDRSAEGFAENHHPILIGEMLFALLGE